MTKILKPPVVVILGHVDHGKSSILEAIKDLKITQKESGGITQHISAYDIEHEGKKITFIDTPGHEAFFAMRSRGSKIADIAVLVIAGDEGIKPQTKEAIKHIKKTGIPAIVAINKMDKSTVNPEKVKRELQQEEITVEGLGGTIPCVEVSAKEKTGIPELLELILLVAEMEKLTADDSKPAQGVVIESYLNSLRGPIATLLVKKGVLKTGDIIATPSTSAKIKSMEKFDKSSVLEAPVSTPVIVSGFNNVPKTGEQFKEFSSMEDAKTYIQKPIEKTILPKLQPEQKVLNLIIKSDVLGSAEAIEETLKTLSQDKVLLRVLKNEVGNVAEADVKLAKTGKGIILAFRVNANPLSKKLAQRENIKIMDFDVIYDLIETVKNLLTKTLKPETVKVELGKLQVLVVFLTEKNRQIIGGKVIEGEITKGTKIEIWRNEEKIGQGKLINLQRNKKDIERATKNEDCGIMYEGDVRIQEEDTLIIYKMETKKAELED